MKRLGLLSACLVAALTSLFAQSEIDALKYSKTDLNGTARYMSMAGAFGALGGDISTLTNNPAGIGVYRTSEFAGTMNLGFQTNNTLWNGSGIENSNTRFHFNNLAYVGTFKSNAEGFVNFNFGIGFNRLKDYYRNYQANGNKLNLSLTDYIATKTNNYLTNSQIPVNEFHNDPSYDLDPWLSVLGVNSSLISLNDDGKYTGVGQFFPISNLKMSERGYLDEYTLSFGANVYDVFYFGASIGISDLNYRLAGSYTEDLGYPDNYTLNNYLETRGSGINLKAGVILRPTDYLRFGLAVHTPTYFKLTDYYDANVRWNDGTTEFNSATPSGAYSEYSLQTPMKLQASAAFIAGKKGILSLEYEYVDYPNMSMKDPDGYGWEANTYIDEDMKAGQNIKIGAEYRVTPQFSLRAGYANQSTPIKSTLINGDYEMDTFGASLPHYTLDRGSNYYTAGFGFRFGSVYTDFAFVSKVSKEDVYAFSPYGEYDNDGNLTNWNLPDKATLKSKNNQILFTLGVKF